MITNNEWHGFALGRLNWFALGGGTEDLIGEVA